MSERRRHWLRIVRKSRKIIDEIEQIIRDANYWNGLPQNQQHTPYDMEPDRLLLAYVRRNLAAFVKQNPEPDK